MRAGSSEQATTSWQLRSIGPVGNARDTRINRSPSARGKRPATIMQEGRMRTYAAVSPAEIAMLRYQPLPSVCIGASQVVPTSAPSQPPRVAVWRETRRQSNMPARLKSEPNPYFHWLENGRLAVRDDPLRHSWSPYAL